MYELKADVPEDISCRYAALADEDIDDAILLHLVSKIQSHSVASDSSTAAPSSSITVVPRPASIYGMPPPLSGRPIPSVSSDDSPPRHRGNKARSAVQESQEPLREKVSDS